MLIKKQTRVQGRRALIAIVVAYFGFTPLFAQDNDLDSVLEGIKIEDVAADEVEKAVGATSDSDVDAQGNEIDIFVNDEADGNDALEDSTSESVSDPSINVAEVEETAAAATDEIDIDDDIIVDEPNDELPAEMIPPPEPVPSSASQPANQRYGSQEYQRPSQGEAGLTRSFALGVSVEPSSGEGVRVKGVIVGSPAEQAGIRPGDTLVSINGVAANDPLNLADQVQVVKSNNSVPVVIRRKGVDETLAVDMTSDSSMAGATTVPSVPQQIVPGRSVPSNRYRYSPNISTQRRYSSSGPNYADTPRYRSYGYSQQYRGTNRSNPNYYGNGYYGNGYRRPNVGIGIGIGVGPGFRGGRGYYGRGYRGGYGRGFGGGVRVGGLSVFW